jgi:phosphohistidine phosphatase
MQLTLVRHAKSSWKDSSLSDRDRPLNGRGKRDAPLMASWLAGREPHYDALLSSPAKRARRTSLALCEALFVPKASLIVDDDLYTFDGGRLLDALRRLDPSWQNVLVVGHNPAITEALDCLCDCAIDNVPTCGIADMEIRVDSWKELRAGCGELRAFETPKELRRRDGR